MARILIIDDDAPLRSAIAVMLASRGHQTTEADNAHDGAALARSEAPDLIIMDVQMPAGGAPMLLQTLDAQPQLAKIPVIVISSMPEAKLKQWFPDADTRRAHSKPIQWDVLAAQIDELLSRP